MNLFPTALADEVATTAAAQDPQAGMFSTLVIFAIIMFFFYFFIVRPQGKKRKETENLLKELKVGDEVLTNGGIVGRIVKISADTKYFVIEISDETRITIDRNFVITSLPKGSLAEINK